jgi:hypothetical protein
MNQNLPSFMVLAPYLPYAGGQVWGSDFLPGVHQGTRIIPGDEPIPNMTRRTEPGTLQTMELGMLEEFNRKHLASRASDPSLAARVKSFETAFGMQQQAPEVFDLTKESDATHKLYGLERGSTKGFAWQCLIARLAERGVRFIELIDSGSDLNKIGMPTSTYRPRNPGPPMSTSPSRRSSRIEVRGMLEDTLVVWTTEFGRTRTTRNPTEGPRAP